MRLAINKGVFGLVPSRRSVFRKHGWLGLLGCALALTSSARAQEALRLSLASEEMADARTKAGDLQNSNLKLGPMSARLQASYGMEYSDNVAYVNQGSQSDIALRPGVNFTGLWPVTDVNSLYFSTGLGYLKYLRFSDLDSFFITPDSAMAFQMYAGDFVFDVHDRFTLTENGSQMPTISSVSGLGEIQNTLGTKVDWDLNKLILSAGYDHDLSSSLTEAYRYIDRQSELFSGRAALQLNPTLKTGLDAAGGLTAYNENLLTDNTYFSAGPFIEAKLSQYISTSAAAGIVNYSFSDGRVGGPGANLNDTFYARWNINHRVNSWLTHSLSLQHDRRLGVWYDLGDFYSADYSATWTMIHHVTLKTGFSYYQGKAYYPDSTEDLAWYGGNIDLRWQISPKFSANALYQVSLRESNQNNGYNQNRLALTVTYTF